MPLNGKIPTVKNWTELKFNSTMTAEKFSGNWGIVLQDDDLVIDVDPRKFLKDDNPIERLKRDIGNDFITFTVKTGGGGQHIYLKKPTNIKTAKHLADYPGLDFQGRGAQVVGCGSTHPVTGKDYTCEMGSIRHAVDAPKELLQMLARKTPDKSTIPGISEYIDDPNMVAKFMQTLKITAGATEGANGDLTTVKVALKARDLGLTAEKTYNLMLDLWNPKCNPPWLPEELERKVNNAYKYGKNNPGVDSPKADFKPLDKPEVTTEVLNWDFDKAGKLKKTLANMVNLMKHPAHGVSQIIKYNELAQQIEFTAKPPWGDDYSQNRAWTDNDSILAKYFYSKQFGFELPTFMVGEASHIVGKLKAFHPVRDWLTALKWDGRPRLDNWLHDYCGVHNTKYARAAGRKTLTAAVARVYQPGIKWDYMLILEGQQRIGKSTVVSILGGEWYGDITLDPSSKDTIQAMLGKWILEISEMECTRKAETNALKAFVSRASDRIRMPYGRITQDYPRQSIFIGTVNPEVSGYLKDTTGNTRYWPVKVNRIDMVGLRKAREQLFAEAVVKYRAGEPLYLQGEEITASVAEQASRETDDPWLNWIAEYVRDRPYQPISVEDVWTFAFGGERKTLSRRELTRITNCLSKMEYQRAYMDSRYLYVPKDYEKYKFLI